MTTSEKRYLPRLQPRPNLSRDAADMLANAPGGYNGASGMAEGEIDLAELQRLAIAELGEEVRTEAIALAARVIATIEDDAAPDGEDDR